jgi:hypothetical protein
VKNNAGYPTLPVKNNAGYPTPPVKNSAGLILLIL